MFQRGLYVSGDLMLGGPVLQAMDAACPEVTRALSGRGLVERLERDAIDLVVIDLEAAEVDVAAIGSLTQRTGRPVVVAYAPHVATGRLAEATAAGFAAVLSRGQAASQLAAVLARLQPGPA